MMHKEKQQADFLEFRFVVIPAYPVMDILIARLPAIGFTGFEEKEGELAGYIPANKYKEEDFRLLIGELGRLADVHYAMRLLEERNWNEVWESGFQPVLIDGTVYVRAPGHAAGNHRQEIIISPERSFGTGHHATTYMMISLMLKEDLKGKKILDMGCGTGILSILAEKLGAAEALAVDNDGWALRNARLNLDLNRTGKVKVVENDGFIWGKEFFDVVLANINLNVLLVDMPGYGRVLAENGKLLLSGFLEADGPAVKRACKQVSLKISGKLVRDGWMAMVFMKEKGT
jgi:ribosomal protein L11 methyltransferase